jgi:hypothetical protein
MKKDSHNHQKEICKADNVKETAIMQWPQPYETDDKSHDRESLLEEEGHQAAIQLQRILAMKRIELEVRPDDLPTSFSDVEMEIAKCISICLTDVPEQMRNTSYVLSLLKVYKVVVPLQDGNPTVSLHMVHVLLQDNFQGSCLCKLMNILLAEWMNTTSKVITFS